VGGFGRVALSLSLSSAKDLSISPSPQPFPHPVIPISRRVLQIPHKKLFSSYLSFSPVSFSFPLPFFCPSEELEKLRKQAL